MNPDEKAQLIQEGIRIGKEHATPSKKTIELFSAMNTQIELMKQDIKNTNQRLEELIQDNKDQHKEIMDKLDGFLCDAEKKFASKEVEKNVSKVTWIIISAVIIALLALIIKQ